MSQSLSNILLHIVFSTRLRQPFIDRSIESELYAFITSIVSSCGSYLHKIGGMEDHVHLLVSLSRTYSARQLLEEIKKTPQDGLKQRVKNTKIFLGKMGMGFSLSVNLSMRMF